MEILRAVDCSFRRTLVDPDLTPYMEEQFADPEMKITEYDLKEDRTVILFLMEQ